MASPLNFTKENIDAIPIPDKRAEYADAGGRSSVNGLLLRVTPTGTKTFCVLKRIKGGKLERFTLGRFPALTIENARRKAVEVLSTVASGENPAEVLRRIRGERTFSEMFDLYLTNHAKPHKRSWEQDEQRFNLYVKDAIGNKKLSQIERRDVRTLHEKLTKAGTKTTANRVLSLISSVYSKAIEWEHATTNPATGIKPNKEKSRDRFLQSDELPRFFASLAAEHNENMRDFFLLALLTGARRSNVLAMQWADVSLERAEWRIKLTKNGDPQVVALSPEAVRILLARKEHATSAFVFPSNSAPGHLVEPKNAWRRILDRDELNQLIKRITEAGFVFDIPEAEPLATGLKRARKQADELKVDRANARLGDLRIHDLRRTLGSWQAAAGASLSIIGKSLNHRSTATTAIYARLNIDPVRESVNRATEAMLATLQGNFDQQNVIEPEAQSKE
jgi:integrase